MPVADARGERAASMGGSIEHALPSGTRRLIMEGYGWYLSQSESYWWVAIALARELLDRGDVLPGCSRLHVCSRLGACAAGGGPGLPATVRSVSDEGMVQPCWSKELRGMLMPSPL